MTLKLTQKQKCETLEEILVANTRVTLNCWEWEGELWPQGYGKLRFQGTDYPAHRKAFEEHHGRKVPKDMVVMHVCDNRKCVNPYHLSMGTHQDNMDDMVSKGRNLGPRGKYKTGNKKLSAAAVKRIFHDERPVNDIVAEYGVSRSTVYGIKASTVRTEVTQHIRKKKLDSTKLKKLV